MNNNTSNLTKVLWTAVAVVAVIVIALAIHRSNMQSSSDMDMSMGTSTDMDMDMSSTSMADMPSMPTGTSSTAANSSTSTMTFAYSLTTATSTYTGNQEIDMTLAVLNLTNAPITMSFKNGCQATYSIAGFNMIDHIVCTPAPTSFVVQPHDIRQIPLAHFPSVYVIPPGHYTLSARIIGYGGTTIPITITN